MNWNKPTRSVMAIVIASIALIASFGIALAAAVQVTQQIPADVNLAEVEVLADENLVISHDFLGLDPVTSFDITLVDFQPPLEEHGHWEQTIYIRNEFSDPLTLVEPCSDVFDDQSELNLGHNRVLEVDGPGSTCDDPFILQPGVPTEAVIVLENHGRTEAGPGNYSFTVIFGAIGEGEVVVEPPPAPQTPNGTAVVAIRDVPGGENGLNSAAAPEHLHYWGIGETLFLRDADDTALPWIAESWSVEPDLSGATISIRSGIPFQTNKGDFGNLTAHDVAFSMNNANAATNGGSVHGQAGDFAGLWGEWVATNDTTIEFDFTNFDSSWKDNFLNQSGQSFSVFSKQAFDDMGEAWAQANVVATGPFEIGSWSADDQVTLQSRYAGGGQHYLPDLSPQTETVQLLEVSDPATRVALLLNGVVDASELDFSDTPQFADSGYGNVNAGGGSQEGLFFSGNLWEEYSARPDEGQGEPNETLLDRPTYVHDLPWLGNPFDGSDPGDMEEARLIRRALAVAIDRQTIVDTVLHGLGKINHVQYFDWEHPNWTGAHEYYYDPVEAANIISGLVDPSYLKNTGSDALNGNAFQITIYSQSGESTIRGPIADAVAGYWAALGLETYSLKYAYQIFRPTVVSRTNTMPWITACDKGNTSWQWGDPKGLVQTSLTRGGFSCGFEAPEIVDFYGAMGSAPDQATAEQAANDYLDFVYFWNLQPGVVTLPPVEVYFNPNKIMAWPMDKSHAYFMNNLWDLELQ